MTNVTHSDKTSADKKIVGLDFQYYFFLYRVLQLRTNQTAGLEVADDVHTELEDDHQILFQLKHTLQQQADGSPVALTPLDSDLWKTMSNWSKVISDPVAGRETELPQVSFVNRTDFVLATNKSRSVDPTIPHLLSQSQNARKELEGLKDRSDSATTSKQIEQVLALNDVVLPLFIKHVRLDLEVDDMIARCKTLLAEMRIPPQRIDQLFRDLDSQIRQDNYLAVKGGRKVRISYSDFNRKYRAYFDSARSQQLQIRREYVALPDSLESQTFIQQLLDINDFPAGDVEQMAELTKVMKHCERNLLRWEVEGEITQIELDQFDTDAITWWSNTFRACHRTKSLPEEQCSLDIVDKLRGILLTIRDQQLGPEFSNGQFYKLADVPRIGFRTNWQSVFCSMPESA